jgi:fatty acid desaturase
MQKDLPIELYLNLKKELESLGFFERRYFYYFCLSFSICLGFFLSFYFLTFEPVRQNPLLIIINGIFLGFLTVQAGMFGHDLSHGQVFKSNRISLFFSTLAWSLFVGLSQKYWYEKHNAHHKEPNHDDSDPDLDIIFTFDISKPSRLHKIPILKKYFIPYQHLLFFPLLPLMYFGFFKTSLKEAFVKF